MIAKVLEIAFKGVMENHCYRWKGEMFSQGSGCAIGLALSGEVAQIRMNRWLRIMKMTLEENLCKIYAMEKYVDDLNVIMEAMGLGVR